MYHYHINTEQNISSQNMKKTCVITIDKKKKTIHKYCQIFQLYYIMTVDKIQLLRNNWIKDLFFLEGKKLALNFRFIHNMYKKS